MFLPKKRAAFFSFLIILAVLLLLALFVYGWKTAWLTQPARAQYQAVFLTNGQVYFGQVQDRNAQYLKLTDVYYLQSVQPLQEPQPVTGGTKKTPPPPAQPELTLVKLGQELHGPRDYMHINRDQVLFIEDLRDDGKVADAMKRYVNK